jgi:CheY-like chemotaxis protein
MMKRILIVEDNPYKREKIVEYFSNITPEVIIDEAHSFTSGWQNISSNKINYDLLILDMSLPSFDINQNEDGGEFKALGGKELARKLVRRKVLTPFIFLTNYKVFSDTLYSYTFDELKKELLTTYPEQCIGFIFFSNRSSEWREDVSDILKGLTLESSHS